MQLRAVPLEKTWRMAEQVQAEAEGQGWQSLPDHVAESKAKAAGVLGTGAVVARALKQQHATHTEQLMQHLVLLQSAKVKAKLAHLEELWLALQAEREEVQSMKQLLFRERIEIAKERLLLKREQEEEEEDANE